MSSHSQLTSDRAARAQPGNLPAPDAQGRRVSRLLLAGLLVGLTAWMARSYLVAVGWAVIIAVSVWPLYTRIRGRARGSDILVPLAVTVALCILLTIPIALALVEVGREGQFLMQALADAKAHGAPVPTWVQHLPLLGQRVQEWWETHLSRPEAAADLLSSLDRSTLTTWFRTLGGELVARILLALITFVALFAILRNGERIGGRGMALIDRWFGAPGDQLADRMAAAVRGTVNGTLLVALGEGFLIGLGYVVAGVPHAVLFGLL